MREAQIPIELDRLRVVFGKRTILEDLEGAFQGRCIGLLGPNGAGKTTLIHTLLGFHAPAAGTARIFGYDIRTEAKQIRAFLGYMPERDAYLAGMSCVQFVRMMGELSGLPAEAALERAHEVLFQVGLGEARYRPIGTYSLGMKQLAKLAQAIVHAPRLLFLDEPTNGLDPPARRRMLELIGEIRDSGRTHIVLSSHLLRDVEACCDEILILRGGRKVANCNLAAERQANRHFVELEIRGGLPDFAEALTARGGECFRTGPNRLKVVLPREPHEAEGDSLTIRDLYHLADQHQIQLRRLTYKRDSLEEIFLQAMDLS